jgi:hypothetical protein
MKKSVLFAAALVAGTAAIAQTGEITSNRGENWLSQDGDWGLTFDATPFLNYAGNLFNNTSGNNIGNGFDFNNNMFAIQGKKLVDANTAYRGMVRIGFGSLKETTLVNAIPQPTPPPFPPTTVENVVTTSNFDLVLGGGLEKRVGSSRVVGIYGGEAYIMLSSEKDTYDYGNALSADNQTTRETEVKRGSRFGFGLGAFVGVEWFCAPKISLSGEYSWGLMLSSQGFDNTSFEDWDPTANNNAGAIRTYDIEGPTGKTNEFRLDTGVSRAMVGINFYFQ